MYTEDVKVPAASLNESSHPNGPSSEVGPALEVLELANGEVIWQVPLRAGKCRLTWCLGTSSTVYEMKTRNPFTPNEEALHRSMNQTKVSRCISENIPETLRKVVLLPSSQERDPQTIIAPRLR